MNDEEGITIDGAGTDTPIDATIPDDPETEAA